jgi:hypothetical protein
MMVEPSEIMNADVPAGTSQVVLLIPGSDRDGQPIEQERWVDDALLLLGRLFRGATSFPPGKGVWRDDERGGALMIEQTVMVLSYVAPQMLTEEALIEVRNFLLRFGRETTQGEVGVIIDGTYYGYTSFERSER